MDAKEFYIIELQEDWIFDRQRSSQYFDIQTVTVKIPAEGSNDGLEKVLASFKYKDLVHSLEIIQMQFGLTKPIQQNILILLMLLN